MTSQQRADNILWIWQLQRQAGIKPEDRKLPDPVADSAYERDLDVLRKCLERTDA